MSVSAESDITQVSSRPRRWIDYRPSRLARNAAVTLAGLGLRALLQGVLFIGVARVLGAQGYGEFVAALSAGTLLAPFVGLGSAVLMVRETARKPDSFAEEFGRSLQIIGLTSIPLLALALLTGVWLLGPSVSWKILVPVTLAELICVPLIELVGCAFQAFEHMGRMALIFNGLMIFRLVGFLVLLLSAEPPKPATWATCYFATSALAALSGVLFAGRELGRPRWRQGGKLEAMREGFFFALGGASHRVQADIDKALLARLDSASTAGIYSAAYRFADLAILPVQALLSASLARFFRAGEHGTAASVRYALVLLPVPLVYAITAGMALFFLSDVLPRLLGPSFAESADIARWLALLPLMALIRYFLARIANASGRQQISSIVYGFGASLNALLNVLWIPLWGWKGSVLATFTTEGLMILCLLLDTAWQAKTTESV